MLLATLPLASPSTISPVGALFNVTSGADVCELLPGALCVTARADSTAGRGQCTFEAMEAVSLTHASYVVRPGLDFLLGFGSDSRDIGSAFLNFQVGTFLNTGTVIEWIAGPLPSNSAGPDAGFTLCASVAVPAAPPPPPPSPSPPIPPQALLLLLSGSEHCEITRNGTCLTDGPGYHDTNEDCSAVAVHDLYLSALQYDVEHTYDYITVGTTEYRAPMSPGPQHHFMRAGELVSWYSDVSVVSAGFTVCASTVGPPTHPPLPPSAPPPPQPPSVPLGGRWELITGSDHCHITNHGTCLSDGFGDYGTNEHCVARAVVDMFVTALYYDVEYAALSLPPSLPPSLHISLLSAAPLPAYNTCFWPAQSRSCALHPHSHAHALLMCTHCEWEGQGSARPARFGSPASAPAYMLPPPLEL